MHMHKRSFTGQYWWCLLCWLSTSALLPELCECFGPAWQLFVFHVQGYMGTSTSLRGQGGVKAVQEHTQACFDFGSCMCMAIWLGLFQFGRYLCDKQRPASGRPQKSAVNRLMCMSVTKHAFLRAIYPFIQQKTSRILAGPCSQ